ncbi:hypothetical protein CJ030_MR5G027244 [Morella rubra]|uniref:CHCH domain-containing protein n=1 Tax=Morella rubra TaxID=262757 RepID=A0A6A1VMN4_9ROSI|nr:hypothetical protein CJ030_MR5G027244 [Morella rubra]
MDKQPMRPNPTERQSQQQPALHQSDADDDDENVKQLNECSHLYLSLQECLNKTDRNWRACQIEVKALKACNEKRKK